MNPRSTISARISNTAKAVGLSLVIILGVVAVNPQSSFASSSIVKGGAALIANTGGSTVRIRSGAGTENDQVAEAHEGESVAILDGPARDSGGNSWYKVSAPGGTGWVISDFLQGTAVKLVKGGTAVVANTGGDTIRVRSGAGTSYDQVAEAHEGETVSILDGPARDDSGNTWYKVSAPGGTGWMVGDYLEGRVATAGSTGGGSSSSSTSSKSPSGIFVGGKATVANTGGDPVRIRSGAGTSYDQVADAREGQTVSVLDGPAKDDSGSTWYKVSAPSGKGWIVSDFLAGASAGSGSSKTKLQAPAGPKLSGFARVGNSDGDPVRLRETANGNGKVVTEFQPDTSVAIKQGPVTDDSGVAWYQVSVNSLTGWMMAQYLIQSSAPSPAATPAAKAPAASPAVQTKPAPPAAPPPPPPPAPAPTPAPAQPQAQAAPAASSGYPAGAVVSLGLKYVGSAYRMGGVGPRSFDCSGFVYYILNHSGWRISRDMYAQWSSGTHVSSSDLQPGDLVFFSNTYKRGLSHVAIYIGNGRIVHAENAGTGVTISDLWSSYYRAHYTGAVRPGK